MELTIRILHSIPGRVRINFSGHLAEPEKLKQHVMEHDGIYSMFYSPVTSNMLINFDHHIVELQEILIRSAVAFSLQNRMVPVRLTQKSQGKFITLKALAAGISITVSAMVAVFSSETRLKIAFDWISAITTSAAVLEHAGYDFRKKGSVDPEVFSLVFLAHWAISGRKMILPSALTWLATFGRHFSPADDEGVLLRLSKAKGVDNNARYEVGVAKLASRNNYLDILNTFAEKFLSSETGFDNTIFEKSKGLLDKHHETLEGIGEKVNGIVLNFKQ